MLFFWLLACTGSKESQESSTNTSTFTTADSCSLGVCNTCNEECSPRACIGSGITMLPGANCLSCHSEGTNAGAQVLGAAGTVFVDREGSAGAGGVTVRLLDANGVTHEQKTVDVGNFAFEEAIAWPAAAEVESGAGVMQMGSPVESGGCNGCHACEGQAGGKLYAR